MSATAGINDMDANTIRKELESEGIFWKDDADVGQRVKQFIDDGLPFDSPKGLQLVHEKILGQRELRETIELAFHKSLFAYFRGFGFDPERAFTLSRYDKSIPFGGCLMVQLWRRDSAAIFHLRSHVHRPPTEVSGNNLLEISPKSLKDPIINTRVDFATGGWAIADARSAFTIEKGYVVIAVFALEEVVRIWKSKMIFPNNSSILEMIRKMTSDKIGLNIELGAPQV